MNLNEDDIRRMLVHDEHDGCPDCRFWCPIESEPSYGECHRRAFAGEERWPRTGDAEWCGDFEKSNLVKAREALILAFDSEASSPRNKPSPERLELEQFLIRLERVIGEGSGRK